MHHHCNDQHHHLHHHHNDHHHYDHCHHHDQGHVSGGRISVENPEFGFLEVSSRPHSVPQAFGPDRDDDDDVVDNDDGDDDD